MTTYHCTGRCRHCSVGDTLRTGKHAHIDGERAAGAVAELADIFDIQSIMTFGGEPLLYPDAVDAIHNQARECGIQDRTLITNGYFSKDPLKIRETAMALAANGVNCILLSADSFHQETIPVDIVRIFAEAVKDSGIPNFKLHPAWVLEREHSNAYNFATRDILNSFSGLGIEVSEGNNIFMAGNAIKYLSEFYEKPQIDLSLGCGQMPYTAPLTNVTSLSIAPNGDVKLCHFTIGNIYKEDIKTIVTRFNPYNDIYMKELIAHGVQGLVRMAAEHGISIDTSRAYSVCDVCRKSLKELINE